MPQITMRECEYALEIISLYQTTVRGFIYGKALFQNCVDNRSFKHGINALVVNILL